MKETVTKQDIISNLSQKLDMPEEQVGIFMSKLNDLLLKNLPTDKEITIDGVGTFSIVWSTYHKNTKLKDGEPREFYKLKFEPAESLKSTVNQEFSHLHPVELSEETASSVPLDTLSRQAEEIKSVLSEIQNEETTDNTVQKDYVDIQESHTETTTSSIEVSDIRQETDVHSDYQPYTPTTTESITVDEPTNTQPDDDYRYRPDNQYSGVDTTDNSYKPYDTPTTTDTSSHQAYMPNYEENKYTSNYEEDKYTPKYEEDRYTPKYDDNTYTPNYANNRYVPNDDDSNTRKGFGGDVYANDDYNADEVIVHRRKSWLWIILAVVVIALAAGGYFMYKPQVCGFVDGLLPKRDTVAQQQEELDTTVIYEPVADTEIEAETEADTLFFENRKYTEYIDTVAIGQGETMARLAEKYYGSRLFWVYIFEANRDNIANANNISVGTRLKIPKLDSRLTNTNDNVLMGKVKKLEIALGK